MRPNPRDPSYVGAIVFFERVAKHLSFSKAADDLGITPSAISHRIARLEACLGKRLFERSPRRVALTIEGIELLRAVDMVLESLRDATEMMMGRSVVRVSIGPYISANWLMPRLQRYEDIHPALRVDLLHRAGWPELNDVDIAIIWYEKPSEGVRAFSLFEPTCVPVAAPGLLDDTPIWSQGAVPLHYRDRSAWRIWIRAAKGPDAFAQSGDVFDDPNLILEAAAHRRGIAIGFLPFIADQLASGRLVRASDLTVQSKSRYWLVRTETENTAADEMLAWLKNEAASE